MAKDLAGETWPWEHLLAAWRALGEEAADEAAFLARVLAVLVDGRRVRAAWVEAAGSGGVTAAAGEPLPVAGAAVRSWPVGGPEGAAPWRLQMAFAEAGVPDAGLAGFYGEWAQALGRALARRENERRRRRLEALYAALAALGEWFADHCERCRAPVPHPLLDQLTRTLAGVGFPSVSLRVPQGARLVPVATAGAAGPLVARLPLGTGPGGCSAPVRAWSTGATAVSSDWTQEPLLRCPALAPWRDRLAAAGVGGLIAVPVIVEEEHWGLLCVCTGEGAGLSAEEITLVERAARFLGLALEWARSQETLARAHERTRRAERLYRAMLHGSALPLRRQGERALLRRICRDLVSSRIFTAAWVGRPGEDGRFRYLAAAGAGSQALQQLRITVRDEATGGALASRAWRSGRIVYNNRHRADPALAPWADFLARYRWESAAAVPIRRGGIIWGVLAVAAARPDVMDRTTLSFLSRVAELAGNALDQADLEARLNRELEHQAWLATHDPLTGLGNRALLSQELPRALARSLRQGTSLALGLLDLDGFKAVNDRLGHAGGDRLLQVVAQRLQAAVRASDLVVRLGGDEFVVLWEGITGPDDLPELVARLETGVGQPVVIGADRVQIGFSLGATCFPADPEDGDALLRHADWALYRAKAAKGRLGPRWRLYGRDTGTWEGEAGKA